MADLIKKIKIKKQDGTFTDYIPIGAEAQNISTSDGDSVQLKLNKKPYYYNSIADMKADTKLKVGDMAVTLGYYEPNDGGAAEYRIVSGTHTDDGGSYHELSNSLFAELIIKEVIYPEQFGAYGDGIHNDTLAIQKAIDIKNNVYFNKNYLVNSELNIYSYSYITFNKKAKILFTGTGACFYGINCYYARLENIFVESSNRTGIGILLEKARNCEIISPHLVNLSTGIKIDGLDTWSASNNIYNPFIYKFNIGIHLTADSGKQTNDTKVIGGYIIDQQRTITTQYEESVCIKNDASCDTNVFIGVACEDADIAFLNQSPVSSTPMSLIGCRAENITSYYLKSTVTCKNLNTIDCSFTLDSEKVSVSAPWDQNIDNKRIDNSYIGSKTGILYYQDSGNSKRQLLNIETSNPKGIRIGPGNGQKQHVIIRGTDNSQVPSNYIIAGGVDGLVFPKNFVMKSTNKYWKVNIDDTGAISTEEYTLQDV